MKSRSIRTATVALVIFATLSLSGCGRYGFLFARAAITTAMVAAVVAHHDSHYHHAHCGHRMIVVDRRPVYQYEGRWEYYDPHDDTWYYYEDLDVHEPH